MRFLFALLCLSLAPNLAKAANLQPVPYVDVSKYLTDWYQIAHIPLWFEGNDDCACARQRLGATSTAGVISVLNTCTQSDGSPYSISGTATSEDPNSNSRFVVSFEGVAFEGSYWIIGLDKDYRYAVVSDKWAYSLYILSKTPTLSKALFDEALAIAQRQELDVSKLKLTQQKNCSYPR